MSTYAPKYYKDFKCTAENCPHNCCLGWRVSLDERTKALYDKARGGYSDQLRAHIARDCDGYYIPQTAGARCPHLDEKGLCRVISIYGDGYLSDICREHPRYYNNVENRLEVGLGASCPEAARLIIERQCSLDIEKISENGGDDVDNCRYSSFKLRERITKILHNHACYVDAEDELIREFALPPDIVTPKFRIDVLADLEYLYPEDRGIIFDAAAKATDGTSKDLFKVSSYFIYRHMATAESENEAIAILGFSVFSTRIVEAMSKLVGNMSEALRIFSEEIEYSTENTERIIFDIENAMI